MLEGAKGRWGMNQVLTQQKPVLNFYSLEPTAMMEVRIKKLREK